MERIRSPDVCTLWTIKDKYITENKEHYYGR
jgi:hypothetical protein